MCLADTLTASHSPGCAAPFLHRLHFTSNPAIMGKYVNGPGLTSSIWLLALAVLSINIYLVSV